MDEALEEDPEEINPEKRNDWLEVRNDVTAMNQAVEALETLPLSNRLLCEAHATLLTGARGEGKTPGVVRRSQNWIGGAMLAGAVFIPPHHEEVTRLRGDLEAFWHNETVFVPELVRIAISHYQFETIHPFLDGNGRIGRLLIALYLVSKGLLHHPCLDVSDYPEKTAPPASMPSLRCGRVAILRAGSGSSSSRSTRPQRRASSPFKQSTDSAKPPPPNCNSSAAAPPTPPGSWTRSTSSR